MICIFDVSLCNIIAGSGQYQLLAKSATYFTHFCFLAPFPLLKVRFLCISPTLFYNLPLCFPIPFLILHILSWKSKLKYKGVNITCFFQDTKSSPIKHKQFLLERSYGTSENSKLELFTKKLTTYSRKQ